MNISRRFLHNSSTQGRRAQESFQVLDQLVRNTTGTTHVDNKKKDGPQEDNLKEQVSRIPKQASIEPLNVILRNWKREYIRSPSDTLHPRQVLEKLDEWRRLLDSNAATDSQEWHHHQRLERLVRPDVGSYTHIMQAVATSIDGCSRHKKREDLNKIHFIDNLLDRLVEESKTDFSIQPNIASFVTLMNAWSQINNSVDESNETLPPSKKVEELVCQMEELHEEGLPNLEPNVVVYNILLHAWAKEGKVKKIEDTLQRMIRLEIPGITPDTVSYTTLLTAYAKSGTPEAALKADSLLHQMLELYNHGMDSAKPNLFSFSSVIHCYARVGGGEKAEEWLRTLQDLYHNGIANNDTHLPLDPDWKPDAAIYNSVIQAWGIAGQPQKAEDVLRRMIAVRDEVVDVDSQSDKNIGEFVDPNSRSFNIVLSAWAKVGEAERAEAILMEMHRLHVENDFDTRPTVISYNTVLDTYAKRSSRMTMNTNEQSNPRKHNRNKTQTSIIGNEEDAPWSRAEAILNHMLDLFRAGDLGVKPTTRTWNTVINVCAKAGQIDQAEKVLDRMTSFYSTSSGDVGSEEITEDEGPSVRTWNTLLSSCMMKGNIRKADQFWSQMKANGVQPDIISYNTLLNCYLRPPKTRTKADNSKMQKEVDAIFRSLRDDSNVEMNHITYLAIVNFWINQGTPKKAESFLLNMANESRQSAKNISAPTRNLFHYVITGWGEHKEPKKAEEVLLKMAELSDVHQFDVRPTTETYNRLLNCWAKSTKLGSGERAEVILREMEALGALGDKEAIPDIYSYNSVLNAWANSGDAAALTRIDKLILEMLLKGNPSLLPDSFSYGTWLKAIASSNEADTDRRLKEVLKAMKIHNFQPNEFIRRKIQSLSKTKND